MPGSESSAAVSSASGASGKRVGEGLQVNGCVELVGHAVGRDLELHRSDCSEHGSLVAAQLGTQHLHDAFLLELRDAAAELLVAPESSARATAKCSGAKLGNRREADRLVD